MAHRASCHIAAAAAAAGRRAVPRLPAAAPVGPPPLGSSSSACASDARPVAALRARGVAATTTAASPSAGARRLSSSDLDAWARGPEVYGHVHSRPASEPYDLSPVREMGKGSSLPEGWAIRLLSAAGMKSSGSPNQDAFSYTLLGCGWIVCVACDGHGEQGEVVAERVGRVIPMYLAQYLPTTGPREALTMAFLDAQADLERSLATAQAFSGAAAAACVIHVERGETWVAHAGDTRVVVGDLSSGGAAFITQEHKPHDPGESDRLDACGAQVISKRYDNDELVSRVFVPKTGMPGLAMSRSLGDGCLKQYGVTAEPEVHDVTAVWDSCMAPVALLASDGLWDTISAEETMATLAARRRAGLDVRLGVEALVRRSQRLWIEAEGDYCDDVTVLLLAPMTSLLAGASIGHGAADV